MKNFSKTMLTGCLLLFLALFLAPVQKVSAYGLTQTDATKNSITVSWTAEENALNYSIYVGTDSTDAVLYQTVTPTVTSITISGLPAGTSRYIKVEYDYYSYDKTKTYTTTAGTMYDAITLPGKVTGLNQERWYYFALSFYAEWDKMTGVDGYEYQVTNSNGKKIASGTSTGTSFNVNQISNKMIYLGKVRAYTTFNGQKYYGEWSDTAYFFTQPRLTKLQASKKGLTVKWGKVSGATGYDVYVSLKPTTGYKKVKSVGKSVSSVKITKFKGKKIKPKKSYYVYIVTKKKVGKITYTSGKLYYWDSKGSLSDLKYL